MSFKSATRLGVVAVLFASTLSFAAPDKKIERLWKAKCGSCHGADGKGQTDQGKKMAVSDMTTAEYQKSHDNEKMKKVILEGFKAEKDGVKQEMEAYKDLKPEQVDGLIEFIRSLGPQK